MVLESYRISPSTKAKQNFKNRQASFFSKFIIFRKYRKIHEIPRRLGLHPFPFFTAKMRKKDKIIPCHTNSKHYGTKSQGIFIYFFNLIFANNVNFSIRNFFCVVFGSFTYIYREKANILICFLLNCVI